MPLVVMVLPSSRLSPPSNRTSRGVLPEDLAAQEEQDVEQALHAEDPALAEA